MNSTLSFALLLAAALGTLSVATVTAPTPPPRPNILMMLVDDMGYSDVAAFGSTNVSTPHIDALIRRGVKMTQWISAASICTPSRASLQTGRYPIRTGCMGNVERYRVILSPSNIGGLDPTKHTSIATALKTAGYATGMSGKWHLGINSNKLFHAQDHKYMPTSHGYDTYLGAPWTNAPMCAMDSDGISNKYRQAQTFCFMTANTTVVQMPLRVENFTSDITDHAVDFIANQEGTGRPWFFFMSWFHVHTPLFTNRTNRGRSRGGQFGDNVEELDDSVGALVRAVDRHGFTNNTLIFFTSDNGPYQEEGWASSGRTNLYDATRRSGDGAGGAGGSRVGRLKGGKGQLYEGGVRMPGAVVWPGVVEPNSTSDVMVSTMDVFPTALAAAGVSIPAGYVVDGKDMKPVLLGGSTSVSQHGVFLHYCGFNIVAARVQGRFKVFFATQKWYTNDEKNSSICLECCNGINPSSRLVGATASELCGCSEKDLTWYGKNGSSSSALPHPVYDMATEEGRMETNALSPATWPNATTNLTYAEVVRMAIEAKAAMIAQVDPKPDHNGAGTCTEGLPGMARQPCCPGCRQLFVGLKCVDSKDKECDCNTALRPARAPALLSLGSGPAEHPTGLSIPPRTTPF